MNHDQLKLENQVCFPIYVASRLIIREYQPLLSKLGITYPQYLVMLVLWENDGLTVNQIADKLLLNTNTVTPLLKRIQDQGLLSRERSTEDERRVIVKLTDKGHALKEEAATIPEQLVANLHSDEMSADDLEQMMTQICEVVRHLSEKQG